MVDTPAAAPPRGLGVRGRELWTSTVLRYQPQEHELQLLLEVARTVDLLDLLQVAIDRDGPLSPWGDGLRAHPAAVEARQHRIALARLVAALGFTDDEDVKVEAPVEPRRVARAGGTPSSRRVQL